MKTTQHKVGLIAKKCVELKLKGVADAFLDWQPHVGKVYVDVRKINDYESVIYSGSACIDGCFNSSRNATNLDEILESLDAIMHGLGVE